MTTSSFVTNHNAFINNVSMRINILKMIHNRIKQNHVVLWKWACRLSTYLVTRTPEVTPHPLFWIHWGSTHNLTHVRTLFSDIIGRKLNKTNKFASNLTIEEKVVFFFLLLLPIAFPITQMYKANHPGCLVC